MWKLITFLVLFKLYCHEYVQGSILGPISLNIFLNLLALLRKSQRYNFAYENTISAVSKSTNDLFITLKNESELALKWFWENNMIINPVTFQAIVLQKRDKKSQSNWVNIDNKVIETRKSVKLLSVTAN